MHDVIPLREICAPSMAPALLVKWYVETKFQLKGYVLGVTGISVRIDVNMGY